METADRNRFPFKKFLVLSVLVPLVFLGAAECLCRLFSDPTPDPAGTPRLFEPSGDGRALKVRAAWLSTFHPLEIAKEKPDDTVRILCLGGSSTYGFPFGRESAFPRWLQELLEHSHPEKRWEVLNLGGMSYGSRRILALMPELLSLDPDVVLLYSGHNEFVERAHAPAAPGRPLRRLADQSRLVQVLRAGISRQGPRSHPEGPEVYREPMVLTTEAERNEVVAAFGRNYRAILESCRTKGVAAIAATVPSSLGDWRPDGSRRSGTGDEAPWQKHYDAGGELLAKGDAEDALAELDAAAAIDPTHALLQFLRGQCLLELERHAEARTACQLARDHDAAPQRALSAINDAIRSAARDAGVRLVDCAKRFEDESDHGIVGKKLIEDYVHPTLLGHRIIAAELYGPILEALPRLGLKAKPRDGALAYLSSLEVPEPRGTDQAAFFYNLGLKFINQRNWEKVLEVNQKAVESDPNHALAYNNLGRGYQELGQPGKALECFQTAVRLRPDLAGVRRNLGAVLQALKETEQAIAALRKAVELRPDDPYAHYLLAISMADTERMDQAIAHYQEAIRIKPDYFEALANLGLACALTGRNDQARDAWQKALRIRPNDPVVKEWVNKLER